MKFDINNKKLSKVMSIVTVIFVLLTALLTAIFVSVQNNNGVFEMGAADYFAYNERLYVVYPQNNFKIDENCIGSLVAYVDANENFVWKSGIVASVREITDREFIPKAVLEDGTVVGEVYIKGIASDAGSAALFSLVTSGSGFIVIVVVPGIILVVYYLVAILAYYKSRTKNSGKDVVTTDSGTLSEVDVNTASSETYKGRNSADGKDK